MGKGKYDHVINKLPKLLGEDPGYQDKVDAVKRAMAQEEGFKRQATWLAEQYAEIRTEKDLVAKMLSEINLRLSAVTQMMIEQYEVEGIKSVALATGETPRVQWEPYGKVEDPDAFRVWCIKEGLENKMVLHPSTTQALVKDRCLGGEPDPPGVKTWSRPKVVLG